MIGDVSLLCHMGERERRGGETCFLSLALLHELLLFGRARCDQLTLDEKEKEKWKMFQKEEGDQMC